MRGNLHLLRRFEGEVENTAMAPVPASVVRQAELLDANGKKYFEKRRFLAAVDAHTEVDSSFFFSSLLVPPFLLASVCGDRFLISTSLLVRLGFLLAFD